MTFHCVAEGNPGPQYLWTRGRQDSLVQVAITILIAILIIIIKALLLFYDHCLHDQCHQCVKFSFLLSTSDTLAG